MKQKVVSFSRLFRYLVLIALSILFIFPFYWMLSTSLKVGTDIFAFPPKLIPNPITFQWYGEAWTMQDFTLYLINTLKIVGCNVILAVLSSALVAYGFARIRFRGRNILFVIVLATMILPNEVLILPQYMEFNLLGWINSHAALIVPNMFGFPFFIFLIHQYLKGISSELDEAATIDGCNRLQIFFKILLPLLTPVLATCVIFQFMNTWNDYMGPLIYLQTRDKWTMALGIASINSERLYSSVNWGHRMAMSTLYSIPPLLVFFFAQDKLIGGISMSGMKG
ncbi:carbohydrate ABC transporter permease [Massiliimalia massiliensis]|uniref:carbohydrate ABC transporter permease n=1 Tax=Massiliimalia massiliensis TaxID=1852384 RepID=UPI000986F2C5|nr:carbohydrate ABC transporter permease [Massiliimalia massiliensis]